MIKEQPGSWQQLVELLLISYEDPMCDFQQCKNLPVSKQTPSIQVLRIFYVSLL